MIEAVVMKREIQARYDDLGEKAVKALGELREPAEVWRVVEGDRPTLAYFRRRKIETVLEVGGFAPGSTILEVGCGTGDYTFLFRRLGYKMVGVDLSPKSIDAARRKAAILGTPDVSFMVSDAETLAGFVDGSVDGVISLSALRYVPDLGRALAAIRRVLRPNGVAVLDFPNRFCPWFMLLKTHFGVERHIHDHQYSTQETVTLMCGAGFQEVSARRILFTTYVLPARLLPLFKGIDWIGERTPLLNVGAGIIVVRGRKP